MTTGYSLSRKIQSGLWEKQWFSDCPFKKTHIIESEMGDRLFSCHKDTFCSLILKRNQSLWRGSIGKDFTVIEPN